MKLFERKKLLLITIAVLTVLIYFGYFIKVHLISKVENYFIQYNSYVAADKGSDYTLDISYFQDKGSKPVFTQSDIINVSFKDSKLTAIKDFKIMNGETSKKHYSKTLSLNVGFKEEGIENINSIEIQLKDGKTFVYKIGNIKIDISDAMVGQHIKLLDNYPLVKSRLTNYDLSLKNLTDEKIAFEELNLDLKNIKVPFQRCYIDPYGTIDNKLNFEAQTNKKDEICFVRPRIIYKYKGEIYCFYPSGVYYGLLQLTDEDIGSLVRKAM